LVSFKICFQKIGEEKYFKNGKHDKQFDEDNQPELPAPKAHIPKSVYIKIPDPLDDKWFFLRHNGINIGFLVNIMAYKLKKIKKHQKILRKDERFIKPSVMF
jgi:hypothetical protein